MSHIQKAIQAIPENRIALSFMEYKYSYGQLKTLFKNNAYALQVLNNSCVVVKGRDRIEFALLLSLLDGHVSKILFLPSDIDTSLHNTYYNESGINFEVYMKKDQLCYNRIFPTKIKTDIKTNATQWIIPTSGTTDIPKLVSHTFYSLTKTAKLNIDIGDSYRWGLVFDIYRFSGIQVFLQSILAGSTLIITKSSQSISEILNTLIKHECNALSATPSFWRKALMSKELNNLKLRQITLGGEIADEHILQALKKKFPHTKILHIYASTEVGVGFSVTDSHAGFPVSYLDGDLENIKMKIDQNGLLWIKPKNYEQSYISKINIYDDDGYINTGDLVKKRDARVYFLGRSSGAINVGGNKVQPEEVELKLTMLDCVNAAYVYAIKNHMMGSLVCADIVLTDTSMGQKEAKIKILTFCRKNLESFKIPAILKFVKELKTTQAGKLKRSIK